MATSKARKGCTICGKPLNGRNALCAACTGLKQRPGPATVQRVGDKVRDRLADPDPGTFVCPFCRCGLSWENVGTTETEVTIYVREKIYYCPSCRAFLGVSSWHTEG